MSRYPLVEARKKLGKIMRGVHYEGPALVTDTGAPAGVIVSPEWYELRRDEHSDPSLDELVALPVDSGSV